MSSGCCFGRAFSCVCVCVYVRVSKARVCVLSRGNTAQSGETACPGDVIFTWDETRPKSRDQGEEMDISIQDIVLFVVLQEGEFIVRTHHLEYCDGGILDPDDTLSDLVEDRDKAALDSLQGLESEPERRKKHSTPSRNRYAGIMCI
ncbi:hypothetical protein WMY93_030591 [Mugilogobius chulae]|uniref:Par3/HAL N-terminal domain-containing protein n=1 Tax=Mugilogobius chulae TaxID=88201 RepID=A0AAW0MNW1_9GOBI